MGYSAVVAKSLEEVLVRVGFPPSSTGQTGVPQHAPVHGEDWSVEPEVRVLLSAIASRMNAHSYVEVGAYRGDTLMHVAAALPTHGHAYGIEPDEDRAAEIEERIASAGQERVTLVRKSSQAAFNAWGREPIDLILIDGDHSLPQAVFDMAAWSTLLSSRGVMAVHDTITRLERRFPEDYLPCPWDFDILDVVGLQERQSNHVWEGLALMRWRAEAREHVDRRFLREAGW